MKDFVSYRATTLVGGIASLSIIGATFSQSGLRWPVLVWGSLVLAVGALLALRSSPSMRQVIRGGEPVPLLAVAAPPGARPRGGSRLRPRETGTR